MRATRIQTRPKQRWRMLGGLDLDLDLDIPCHIHTYNLSHTDMPFSSYLMIDAHMYAEDFDENGTR